MVYILIALIIALNRLPMVGKVLKVLSTMFHELGHALMAIFTFGKVYRIRLFHDNTGLAETGSRNWVSSVLVTMAGYPMEIAMAYGLLFLYANGYIEALFFVLGAATLITFVFIRNFYGFLWLVAFGGFLYLGYVNMDEIWVSYSLLFIVLVTLGEALYSSFSILVLSLKNRHQAGDATDLADKTLIPAPVWGFLFIGFALFIFYHSIKWLSIIDFKNPF